MSGSVNAPSGQYLSTSRPRQVIFTSGQVNFQFTCPKGQVEILEEKKPRPVVVMMILASFFSAGKVKYQFTYLGEQVEVNSEVIYRNKLFNE